MKKTRQYFVGILWMICILLIGYFLGIRTHWEDFLNARRQTYQLEKTYQETRIKIHDTALFQSKLRETRNDFNALKATLPSSTQFPAFLKKISQLAETEGLKVISITPQTLEPQDFQHHDFYDSISLELNLQGTYHQFLQFLQKLHEQRTFVAFAHFTLMRQSQALSLALNKGNQPDLLTMNANAEFYCLP